MKIKWNDFQEKGRTNTAEGLTEMRRNMFTPLNGDRSGDPNIAIVITDGRSNIDRFKTIPAAEDAKGSGIDIFAVGEHIPAIPFEILSIENIINLEEFTTIMKNAWWKRTGKGSIIVITSIGLWLHGLAHYIM